MSEPLFSAAEARRFLSLGLPVFVAQLSQTGMTFVDTAMTGQYATADMAAVAVAGSIWAPLSLLGVGCLLALSPMSAHLVGGGQRAESAHLLRQGIWLTCCLAAVLMALLYVISYHIHVFGLEPHLADLAGGYLRAMIWGLPGFMLFVNVRSFLEGFSRTRPAMVIGLLGLALNIPCNYGFIYGVWGLPRLGAVGCGVATSLCYWFMALSMVFHARRDRLTRDLGPLFLPLLLPGTAGLPQHRASRFDPALILRIFRIGFPGALAIFFEVSLFALTALLLAPLGEIVVAGHQIALNYSALIFMVPMSLNITATIRVGHLLGGARVWRARTAARTALVLGAATAVATAAGTVAGRHGIVAIYNNDPAVAALAVRLLLLASVYQVVDALQTISIGILRAYNDTRIISLICFSAYGIIGLPLGFVLSRTDWLVPAMGAQGFWIAYIAALSFGAVCYLCRVRHLHRLSEDAALQKIHK
ncbi:MATE family efflux transporter [uncultured Desulfovibrio sp.]|uniref:MATE family efflux transporter n=1 Tax=uncultured Desulfovibrio sp. TaxID=167968 RepID=UPI00260AD6A4|nr:MATE family efflux transporter [uncultured Desulfovibrio sp.]